MRPLLPFPLFLILISAFLNAAAQVFLKVGIGRESLFVDGEGIFAEEGGKSVLHLGLSFLLNPYICGGIGCYGLSLFFWLIALSRVDLSYAVPLLSVSYVLTALAGSYFFQENLGTCRLLGLALIMGGIYLVSRTSG